MNQPSVAEINTRRLSLHRIKEEDLTNLIIMHSDLQMMRTLGGIRSEKQTAAFLQEQLEHWQRHGYGEWIAYELETGLFVGRGGLRHVLIAGREELEVGYKIMPEFWRQGMATEMASAFVVIAFKSLEKSELVCYTLSENRASVHVMEKVGFNFEREIQLNNRLHLFYRLRRTSWEAQNKRGQTKLGLSRS